MRFWLRASMALLTVTFLFSCSKKVTELDKWPFEARGIKISYKADLELNLYQNKPHTLFVCIYQMKDPNAFNELRLDRTGLMKLLECKRFDQGVSSSESLIVHPGDEETIVFDRAEDARFVGVVAGYYSLWPVNVTKLVLVPVKIEKSGWLIRKKVAQPGQLSLKLYFGPEEVQQILE
jgi:type VI secretion system VasD/TssJ family lipoprotein